MARREGFSLDLTCRYTCIFNLEEYLTDTRLLIPTNETVANTQMLKWFYLHSFIFFAALTKTLPRNVNRYILAQYIWDYCSFLQRLKTFFSSQQVL